MTYKEKLLDPRWQKKRLEILSRDNFSCLICGTTKQTLHVHHLCYPKNGLIWEVDDTALMTLCSDCHFVGHLKDLTTLEYDLISTIQLMGQICDGKNDELNHVVKTINQIVLYHKRKING